MKKLFLLFLLIISLNISLKASHLAGADLTYQCLGGNDYLITFTFYRDCSGMTISGNATIEFKSSCGNFSVSLPPLAGTGQEVTPACPTNPTTCTTGSNYGLQEYVYQATVTLPPCSDWIMYYSNCCRNPSNTITLPTNAGVTIPATLNNVAAPCNSSPVFTNRPVTILCNGQQFCFNHGALEPDGDSLSYSLVTPYDWTGIPPAYTYVSWIAPSTATQPIPSTPPISCDPISGDICITPTSNIVSPMAVLCQEYRKINGVWVLIGSIYRDMQINVISCTNNLPSLPGIDTSGVSPNDSVFMLPICIGNNVHFTLAATDVDIPANNLTLSWNNGIPGGTFSIVGNGTPAPVATFDWVPTSADISGVPHCFTVTVQDNACPYFGTQIFSYCISVFGMSVTSQADTLLCMGEIDTIYAHPDTNAAVFNWTVDGNPVASLNDSTFIFNSALYPPGLHNVSINVDDNNPITSCPGSATTIVNVVPQPTVNLPNDTIICDGQSVILQAPLGSLYFWNEGSTNQNLNVTTTGTYSVTVDGGSYTRCRDVDSIVITVKPMPSVNLGPDSCSAVPVYLDAQNSGLGFTYSWSNSNTSQAITASTSGTYIVDVISIPGSSICHDKDTVNIKVIPTPHVSLGSDTLICRHESIILNSFDGESNEYIYNWIPSGQSNSSFLFSPMSDPSLVSPTVIVASIMGCKLVSDTIVISFQPCDLTVPNVITPDNNGKNDYFHVTNLEFYLNSKLVIYNRWGKKVYENSNYQNDWNGGNYSDGVYYYILNINDNTPEGIEKHGTITIIGKK